MPVTLVHGLAARPDQAGVVAYLALQRSKEMVIRISLGATAGQIARLMLGGMMQLVCLGVAAGVAGKTIGRGRRL